MARALKLAELEISNLKVLTATQDVAFLTGKERITKLIKKRGVVG